MPNWEEDDNSTDDVGFGGRTYQTIDKCAGCHQEIDTTGDPKPVCPLCSSSTWWTCRHLVAVCRWQFHRCAGQQASVTEHVCSHCLDGIAIHDRVARASLRCMCSQCNPRDELPLDGSPHPRSAPPRDNPFDTDDWL